jgi:hypothetical protein
MVRTTAVNSAPRRNGRIVRQAAPMAQARIVSAAVMAIYVRPAQRISTVSSASVRHSSHQVKIEITAAAANRQ